MATTPPLIFAFATKGTGTNEERRLRRLLGGHAATFLPYDKSAKMRSFRSVLRRVRDERPDLLVMEGTGLAGGAACLLTRLSAGQRYVISSGDAVGPFVGGVVPALGPLFGLYERLLCRLCSGYIGWTPYLTGRALTFGAPRAMTAAGWGERPPAADARSRVRAELGLPDNAIVFGLVGSLVWNARHRYCYGAELVRAIADTDRSDICVLVVGDGSGLPHLKTLAGDRLGRSVLLPGAIPAERVSDYMAAMDVGSLPQSVDGVGSFRYTTKLSEYLAATLPIVTGQTPLAYDLDGGWLWRLAGDTPWSDTYVAALAGLMAVVAPADIERRRKAVRSVDAGLFDAERQACAVTAFLTDLLTAPSAAARPNPIALLGMHAPSQMNAFNTQAPAPNGGPLRIAWIGPARESGGVAGMGTQLLESALELGCQVDLYTQEEPAGISPRFARFPNLTIRHFLSGFQWDRWYSRRRFMAFLTSSLMRTRAYRRGAAELIRTHAREPYDCIFQVSQTELFNLGSHRKMLPPIVVYPCVHAAGELRWHRRESRYARASESTAMHFAVRGILWVRSVLQRRELSKPARMIGMSQHFNDLVTQDYGVPAAKTDVLYHPIAAAVGTPGPGSPADGPVRLVYIARLSVRKGLDFIVDLSRRLNDLRGQVTIEVIGGPTLWSNYTAHLQSLNGAIASYGGELSHDRIGQKLATSDGLLLPSRYEPGGLVVGEALAYGTPVVVSDVIGSAEPVAAAYCRRFPDGDAAAFEREVRRLIDEVRQDRTALRAGAAAEAVRNFAPQKIGTDLVGILTRAAGARSGRSNGITPI